MKEKKLKNIEKKNSTSVADIANITTSFNSDSALEDFEQARANMLSMLKSGTLSVEKLADLAERSQNSKMYEVLYNFILSMSQVNKDLLEIQHKIRELKDPDISSNMNAKTINQTAIFCGSTAELQKVIKTMNLEKTAAGAIASEENIQDGNILEQKNMIGK